MRRSIRAMVGAGVMAAASILPLAAVAQAAPAAPATATTSAASAKVDVTAEATAVASGWQRRGPFTTRASCDRVRSQMVSLGYPTQACYYLRCGPGCTTPGVVSGWYYLIWR